MIAQTPVRVLRGTIARCKTPFSNLLIVFFTPFLPEAFNRTKIVKVWERKDILK